MKILIIKLGAIGDVLRTTKFLPALKDRYPNCDIHWLTKRSSNEILKNNQYLTKIFLMEDNPCLKDEKYDLVISLDDEESACKIAGEIKTTKLVGIYIKDNKKIYTKETQEWFDMGLSSRLGKIKADMLKAANTKTYQELHFKMLGFDGDEWKKYEPQLNLLEQDINFASKFAFSNGISKEDLIIGINTGAGGRWKDKKLSIEKTAKLIDIINANIDCKILLFGGPNEIERNERIKDKVKTSLIDAGCNNSLMEFSALVNLCDILVTSDSLAFHIGVALKKKIVVFVGPTSAAELYLYGRGIKIAPDYPCRCCYKTECNPKPDYNIYDIFDGVIKTIKS